MKSMRLTVTLTLAAVCVLPAPRAAHAQVSSGSIERMVESIVGNAERWAADIERRANSLAQRIEREVNAKADSKYRSKSMQKFDGAFERRDRSELTQAPRIDTTFTFSADGSADLSLGTGEIIVRGWDRNEARVRASSERGRIGFQFTRSRMVLDLEPIGDSWRRSRYGETRFEVTLPLGARLRIRTTTGDVTVIGTNGEVEISATTGDVNVEGVRSRLEVETLSGDIIAKRITGHTAITSVSGTISVEDLEGDVRLNSTSGDLLLSNARTSEVEMSTSSGEVSFAGNVTADGRYEFTSHSGTIDITVPASTSARFSVETYSGEIDSAFPITLQPRSTTTGKPRRFEFNIGTGGPRIIAESFSGDIEIRKRN